ncbi:hypothetical protein [Granulicella sp. L60]|uniref:hypothetical protein n=1 Tax=Granulicella sp. L60 TaxID=1641866 RepID=UPI00131CD1B5|nr:hypothetical protein [Granulicella sp. L60]
MHPHTAEPGTCVVLLPSSPHFARLFEEVLSPAIAGSGLTPLRISQENPSPLPTGLLVHYIQSATALFADLSDNHPELWFAVGCAIALEKPLCLISSTPRSFASLTFEQPHIIHYPTPAFPSDFAQLQHHIASRFAAIVPEPAAFNPIPPPAPRAISDSTPITIPISEDLASYEILALSIIDQQASEDGLSPRNLGLEMRERDSAHLTSHAINALKRRGLIARRSIQPDDDGPESPLSENLFLTREGKDWLHRHHRRSSSRPHSSTSNTFLTRR